jgi:hypothetical protein
MSKDPIGNYKYAKEQLDDAYSKVLKIRRTITEVSQFLSHPYEFIISGTDVVFPPEVGLVRTPTLFADNWPSAKQIAQSLVALHQRYRIAQNAWMNLSQADRAQVEKLPDQE